MLNAYYENIFESRGADECSEHLYGTTSVMPCPERDEVLDICREQLEGQIVTGSHSK